MENTFNKLIIIEEAESLNEDTMKNVLGGYCNGAGCGNDICDGDICDQKACAGYSCSGATCRGKTEGPPPLSCNNDATVPPGRNSMLQFN